MRVKVWVSQRIDIDLLNINESPIIIGLDDLGDVLDAVETLSPQWRFLSTKLRIRETSLDLIEHNHPGDAKTCLHKALGEWLRWNYDHEKHRRPSWRRLAEAVKSLNCELFEKIAETHSTK